MRSATETKCGTPGEARDDCWQTIAVARDIGMVAGHRDGSNEVRHRQKSDLGRRIVLGDVDDAESVGTVIIVFADHLGNNPTDSPSLVG